MRTIEQIIEELEQQAAGCMMAAQVLRGALPPHNAPPLVQPKHLPITFQCSLERFKDIAARWLEDLAKE